MTSRELVRDGMLYDTGAGDIRVGPARAGRFGRRQVVVFAFRGTGGPVRLVVRRRVVARFLAASLRACPWDTETTLVDMDAALDRLVRSGS